MLPNRKQVATALAGAGALLGRFLPRTAAGLIVLLCFPILTTCSPGIGTWGKVRRTGELTVATINSATTYYLAGAGPAGFGYDLARMFAHSLGFRLEVRVAPNRGAAIAAVASGKAHFALGLAMTPRRRRLVRFTPAYHQRQPTLVVHTDTPEPDSLAEIDGRLAVPAHTAIAAWLRRNEPELEIVVAQQANYEELLVRVAEKEITATIAPASLVKLNQRYYPGLRMAFKLEVNPRMAWAFPSRRSDTLYHKAVAFIRRIQQSGKLKMVRNRYFGHADRLGFVGGLTFARVVEDRLQRWRDEFKAAAQEYGFDWRLLAAMGYQESHWNPDAVSPTGVRGIMMLTESTAHAMGITDRTDPQASIRGGAKYLRYLLGRLPDSIDKPDRLWAAMAAYNIGLGHVMDAWRLLKAHGINPNRWVNLRKGLKWLSQESYYQHTRYGYAPGQVAIEYVGNIRAYYDILLWMTSDRKMEKPEALSKKPARESHTPEERALNIDTPAL